MERIRISAGRRRSWLQRLRPVLGAVVLGGLIATAWAWALHASGERVYTTGEIKAALHGQPHAWAGRVVLVRGLFGGGEYECRPTSPHCAIPLWMTLKSGCDTAGRCTIALWDTMTTMRGDQEGEDNTGLMLPLAQGTRQPGSAPHLTMLETLRRLPLVGSLMGASEDTYRVQLLAPAPRYCLVWQLQQGQGVPCGPEAVRK